MTTPSYILTILPVDVVGVVSNHDDMRRLVEWYGLPCHHLPMAGDKPAQEARLLERFSTSGAHFKSAKPYHQAHDRGVKVVGATAHYVTADLDEGPIIEQDTVRVDHGMDAESFVRLGKDVENVVLARAVQWHAEHRVMLNGHRTVVFRHGA